MTMDLISSIQKPRKDVVPLEREIFFTFLELKQGAFYEILIANFCVPAIFVEPPHSPIAA